MQEQLTDTVITATTEDGTLSLVAGITTAIVRETQHRHLLSTPATIALGRLATGAGLLGGSLKGQERISLQVVGDGPLGSITAEVALNSATEIGLRAYARNPNIEPIYDTHGKLHISSAIGQGRLQVIKSYEIGQPYVGIVELLSGEIDDDLAGYLLNSQQIPSIVLLSVLEENDTIRAAGGIIAQVMPNADESAFAHLQTQAAKMPDIATFIDVGATPRDIMDRLVGNQPLRSFGTYSIAFTCRCTREKVETALLGLGRDELLKMSREETKTEAICEFCHQAYYLGSEELQALAGKLYGRG